MAWFLRPAPTSIDSARSSSRSSSRRQPPVLALSSAAPCGSGRRLAAIRTPAQNAQLRRLVCLVRPTRAPRRPESDARGAFQKSLVCVQERLPDRPAPPENYRRDGQQSARNRGFPNHAAKASAPHWPAQWGRENRLRSQAKRTLVPLPCWKARRSNRLAQRGLPRRGLPRRGLRRRALTRAGRCASRAVPKPRNRTKQILRRTGTSPQIGAPVETIASSAR